MSLKHLCCNALCTSAMTDETITLCTSAITEHTITLKDVRCKLALGKEGVLVCHPAVYISFFFIYLSVKNPEGA